MCEIDYHKIQATDLELSDSEIFCRILNYIRLLLQ